MPKRAKPHVKPIASHHLIAQLLKEAASTEDLPAFLEQVNPASLHQCVSSHQTAAHRGATIQEVARVLFESLCSRENFGTYDPSGVIERALRELARCNCCIFDFEAPSAAHELNEIIDRKLDRDYEPGAFDRWARHYLLPDGEESSWEWQPPVPTTTAADDSGAATRHVAPVKLTQKPRTSNSAGEAAHKANVEFTGGPPPAPPSRDFEQLTLFGVDDPVQRATPIQRRPERWQDLPMLSLREAQIGMQTMFKLGLDDEEREKLLTYALGVRCDQHLLAVSGGGRSFLPLHMAEQWKSMLADLRRQG